jgi:hypothetical protein
LLPELGGIGRIGTPAMEGGATPQAKILTGHKPIRVVAR